MLGADQTVLMLMGDDGLAHSRAVHGIDPSVAAGLEGELNERLIERLEETLVGGASRAFMAVPLIVQGEVTGLLAVARAGGRAWTPVDEAVLAAVADQSAAPIEIARLSEEVRQARLVAENLRLSEAEREARAELDAERLRLASVLDNIPSGVVLVEAPSGRITFVNRAVMGLLRLPPAATKESVIDILYASVHADGRPYATGRVAPGPGAGRRGSRGERGGGVRRGRRHVRDVQRERHRDPRSGGRHRGRGGHPVRRDPPPAGRAPPAAGAADGGRRAAGRRRGARGQQSDADRAVRRQLPAPSHGSGEGGARGCPADRAGRRTHGDGHRPAPGLQPPPDPAAHGARARRGRGRARSGAAPHARGGVHRSISSSRLPAFGSGWTGVSSSRC